MPRYVRCYAEGCVYRQRGCSEPITVPWPGDVERSPTARGAARGACRRLGAQTLPDAELASIAREPAPQGSPTPVDAGDRRTFWALALALLVAENLVPQGCRMEVTALVRDAQRRLRLASVLGGLAAGFVALAASVSTRRPSAWDGRALGVTVGGLLGTGLVLAAFRRATARWTPSSTAAYVEEREPGLDNLLVTAMDLTTGVIDASARMRAEVTRQAAARIVTLRPQAVASVAWSHMAADDHRHRHACGDLVGVGNPRPAGPESARS